MPRRISQSAACEGFSHCRAAFRKDHHCPDPVPSETVTIYSALLAAPDQGSYKWGRTSVHNLGKNRGNLRERRLSCSRSVGLPFGRKPVLGLGPSGPGIRAKAERRRSAMASQERDRLRPKPLIRRSARHLLPNGGRQPALAGLPPMQSAQTMRVCPIFRQSASERAGTGRSRRLATIVGLMRFWLAELVLA